MNVAFDDRQDRPFATAVWRERLEGWMRASGLPEAAELSVVLVDDAEIHALNREHRGIDRPTDVLSFPQWEPGELPPDDGSGQPIPLGDLVLSLETAERQAAEYGHSVEREVGFLLAHGLLHLLGEDHETPEQDDRMRARQRELLALHGLAR